MRWTQRATVLTVALGLTGMLLVSDLRASTSIAVPFEALVRESSAAAFVTPVARTAVWENGRIVTYTDAHVDTRVAGSVPADDVWIRTLGGEVGDVGQRVEGEAVLAVGHPSLVFLRPASVLPAGTTSVASTMPGVYSVTARAQGQFPVSFGTAAVGTAREPRIYRSSGVGATLAPERIDRPILASDLLQGMTVHDVLATVVAAWGRVHAP
jgi:hypothetical protein